MGENPWTGRLEEANADENVQVQDDEDDDELDSEAKQPTKNAWALTRNVDNPLFPWTDFFTG